jgi:hypothetical protein
MIRRTHPRRPSVRPGVEALEDRSLPACQVTPAGAVLTITGDNGPNHVRVVDDGTAGPGNVSVVCDGIATPLNTFSISQIIVNTGGGNDTVEFGLNAKLAAGLGRLMAVDLGDGHDNLLAAFAGGFNVVSGMTLTAQGGRGRDFFLVNALNGVNLDAASALRLDLNAGEDRDIILVGYNGRMQGGLSIITAGGSDRDRMFTNVGLLSGSAGSLVMQQYGLAGDDRMGMIVDTAAGSTTSVLGLVDGGPGFNTSTQTAFIPAVSIQDGFSVI